MTMGMKKETIARNIFSVSNVYIYSSLVWELEPFNQPLGVILKTKQHFIVKKKYLLT